MPRKPMRAQERGTELGGAVQQNGIQPRPAVSDLKPKEKRQLMVRTGQMDRVDAPARERNFFGQVGPNPKTPPPPKYTT